MSDEHGIWQRRLLIPKECSPHQYGHFYRRVEVDLWRVSLMTARTHRIAWECGPWEPPADDERRALFRGLMLVGTLMTHERFKMIEEARRRGPRGEGGARLHAAWGGLARQEAVRA